MRKIFGLICLLFASVICGAKDTLTAENWKPEVVGEATINSDKLDFDYELYVATFTGNVVIKHPQFTGFADKVVVVFEKDAETATAAPTGGSILGKKTADAQQRVKSAVAIGNVKAFGENMMMTCDNATYFKDNAMVRLTGKTPPVVKKDGRQISGQIITLWLNDDRIETSGDIKLQFPAAETETQK